jgi:23S rRNA pseudouridine1911/1915/1917 synthase
MRPHIAGETLSYAAVYKPPLMHTAPLREGEGGTLLHWFGSLFPSALEIEGRKRIEGGLLFRLDFQTEGLVLIAKNRPAFNALLLQQEEGRIVKEYGAASLPRGRLLPGFPPPPPPGNRIESRFRPYGKGRKAVRPVAAEGNPPGGTLYITEILEREARGGLIRMTLRIRKGFRHQIRCHLAWTGSPILGDTLYGAEETPPAAGEGEGAPGKRPLALRCQALLFTDPLSGEAREYRIAPLAPPSSGPSS